MNNAHTIASLPADVDWSDWLRRWDEQQTGYISNREFRFTTMLDVLAVMMPEKFTVLDLCAGPGSISQRVLARFPQARCIAADLDPLLLALGKAALGDYDGRLRWAVVDLMQDNLAEAMGIEQVDAVLSTTALHWLPTENLVQVYQQLGQLIGPGGVFLNGDHIAFAPHLTTFQAIADQTKDRQENEAFNEQGVEDWERWWGELSAMPEVEALAAERERIFGSRDADFPRAIVDVHEAALRCAGFSQVDTIWQYLDDRIVMACK